jgi:hypothetical protein
MDTSPYAVLQCPPGLRDMALRTLHRNLPEELQAGLVQAIETTGFEEEAAWGGFLSVNLVTLYLSLGRNCFQDGLPLCGPLRQMFPRPDHYCRK